MINVVSISAPGNGGTYRFFLNLREGLVAHDTHLRWLDAGRSVAQSVASTGFMDLDNGTLLLKDSDDQRARADAIIQFILEHDVKLVLLNAMCGTVETCIARYLPSYVHRILVVHTITPSTFRGARAVRDWVHATVAVSPRIRDELIRRHSFPEGRTFCIPNSVDISTFLSTERAPETPRLRVLSHGRVDDMSKGVFWIPEIIRRAQDSGAGLDLTVSGDGPDLVRLREYAQRAGLNGSITFLGRTEHSRVPGLVASHDVFLFPSRFEGLGTALIEAMAGGCVPVASRIMGVTDFVVNHGVNGLLFPVGDTRAAASCLVRLANDREMLERFSAEARRSVAGRFSLEKQAAAFADLMRKVIEAPPSIREPLPLTQWRIPRALQPAWWYPLPEPVKNYARKWRERWRTLATT